MNFRHVRLLDPPSGRVMQMRDGCVPTAAAIGVWASTGSLPQPLATHLQQLLRTWATGGTTFEKIDEVLNKLGIRSAWFEGAPLRDVIEEQHRGGLVIGIDPSHIYDVRPGRHAVVVSEVSIPDYPRGWRDSGLIPSDLVFVEILDPDSSVPERSFVPFKQLKAAFDAAGGQGLLIPGLIVG